MTEFKPTEYEGEMLYPVPDPMGWCAGCKWHHEKGCTDAQHAPLECSPVVDGKRDFSKSVAWLNAENYAVWTAKRLLGEYYGDRKSVV